MFDGSLIDRYTSCDFRPNYAGVQLMRTVPKKELVDRIAQRTEAKNGVVKTVVQNFLDEIIAELALTIGWSFGTSVYLSRGYGKPELHRIPRP